MSLPTRPTLFFHIAVGVISSLSLLIFYYLILRLNSSLGLLYAHNSLRYFVIYLALTLASVIIFGLNMTLLVSQVRKFGIRPLFTHGSGGMGALVGILASSCPVCGSALFSAIGIAGGLSSLPFQGIEIKLISLLLLTVSFIVSLRQLTKRNSNTEACPAPRINHQQEKSVQKAFAPLALICVTLILILAASIRSDTLWSPNLLAQSYTCHLKN